MQEARNRDITPQLSDEFISGGGEMGALMRSMDWSETPLGPVKEWPQSLRSAVSILLASRAQIILFWGPELTALYNDAYAPTLGSKHPWALGKPARQCWAEIWEDTLRSLFEGVLRSGESFYADEHPFFLERHGYIEETYYDVSYDPVRDESGAVGGIFCIVSDATGRVLERRRWQTLRELAVRSLSEARSDKEACQVAAETVAGNNRDVPFALIYLLDPNREMARLAAAAGIEPGTPDSPLEVPMDLTAGGDIWLLGEVASQNRPKLIDATTIADLPCGDWNEPPRSVLVLPLAAPGQELPTALLVAAVSPRRLLDDVYQNFYHTIAGHISTAITHARAYAEERRRTEALTELDRAKTAFFSNVSHEFRTPLTLMLGPMEDLLAKPADALPPEDRERLDVIYRNSLRLLKLVNTLLDFSRIEAGRIQAVYEPTDLAALTAELASVFRSAIERVGLELLVDCAPLSETVYIDREMWEKIVLNLLSNALKFTFEGAITVSLSRANGHVELKVRDTGTGIAEADLPYIFERFHRIRGAQARTHEGTGIGLALVQELARLHGGSVSVESAVGKGTTFTVSILTGSAHLPADRISTAGTPSSTAPGAKAFVEEALRWIPEDSQSEKQTSGVRESVVEPQVGANIPARILLADDNADMREYVERILGSYWTVEAVSDGKAALEAARRRVPDLVLSDIMMPGLDGFELLRELRGDLRTSDVPVIFLSARAGEESRIEGLEAGADDYLVKPFSARELLARVGANLELARLRRETQEQIKNILESITDGFISLDRQWRYIYINAEAERMGLSRAELLGKCLWEAFPELAGTEIETALRRAMDERVAVEFEGRNQQLGLNYINKVYPAADGGLTIYFQDITERKRVEKALRASQAQLQTLFDEAPLGVYLVDEDFRIREVNPTALPVFGDIPDLIGRDFGAVMHILWPKQYADEVVQIFRHTLETGEPYITPERIEERLDRGATEYYEWQINRIPLPEGRFGVVCYFRDISVQVYARQEREKLLEAERVAREAVSAASRAKDEFLATVSHELRTPLNAILGWARLLSGGSLNDETAARGLKSIEQNARAQAQLIEDLLDVSRIISGKLRLNVEPIQVARIIESAIDSVRPAAEAKSVRLQVTLDPDAGPVSGDGGRLQQVVWNLLSNAVKFTPKGGRVQVRLTRVSSHIEIAVSDTGQGVTSEFLPYIFDRFRQADSSSTRPHGGLGLGLAIVRHIVELHGGSVAAYSPGKDQGTTFTVRLPLMVLHTKESGERVHPRVEDEETLRFKPSLSLEGINVLVVDDEPETLLLLSTVLTQSGACVKTASSAAEGFQRVKEWRPDVVVSDIGMPEEDGYSFMRRVKSWAREVGARIPAVALTAFARAEDRMKALESGYQIHVPKPVEPAELVTVIASLIERPPIH